MSRSSSSHSAKNRSLADFNHKRSVANWLHCVNGVLIARSQTSNVDISGLRRHDGEAALDWRADHSRKDDLVPHQHMNFLSAQRDCSAAPAGVRWNLRLGDNFIFLLTERGGFQDLLPGSHVR